MNSVHFELGPYLVETDLEIQQKVVGMALTLA